MTLTGSGITREGGEKGAVSRLRWELNEEFFMSFHSHTMKQSIAGIQKLWEAEMGEFQG